MLYLHNELVSGAVCIYELVSGAVYIYELGSGTLLM